MKFTNSRMLKPDLKIILMFLLFLGFYMSSTSNVCIGQSNNKLVPKGEDFKSFTGNGAWCWFSDPRAIYFNGKHRRTYAGCVDSSGNVMIGFYDHDLKRIETKVLHKNFEKDDHDNPSLFMDRQGNLIVFYSKHATNEPIYLQKTKQAEDISE